MVTNILYIFILLFAATSAQGSVTGTCDTCHVMHASQTGVAKTTNNALLNESCLGCHTGNNTDGITHTPFVYTTGKSDLSGALAGGNFLFADTDERYGHNPVELSSGVDSTLTGNPPGWKTGFNANGQVGGASPAWASNDLSCAGTYGCHGTHDADGVFQTHHYNPTGAITAPTTAGNSYRFLYKIQGYEDNDYQFETTDYNIYLGVERSGGEAGADTPTDTATMSYLCAECHGIFHSGSGSEGISSTGDTFFSNPWIRHPVDISMPTTGEYAAYNSYNVDAPVASSDVSNGTISVALGSDRIVFCLSCHQAHATSNYAILRWNYRGSAGSWTNGCANCHTNKN